MSADRPTLSPEAERLLDARNEAITELKAIDGVERTITDPYVIRLSVARLFEQSVTMRVLAGEPVASSELQNATRMVSDAREALPPKPLEVKLVIVRRSYDELAAENPALYPPKTKQPKPSTPKLLPPPAVIDGEVVQASNSATPDVRAPNAAPVYPRRDPGSIHDFPGARMRPGTLAQLSQQGGLNGTAYNPLEKAPDWDAKHRDRVPEQFWPGPFGS